MTLQQRFFKGIFQLPALVLFLLAVFAASVQAQPPQFAVTPSVVGNGTIAPDTLQYVTNNKTALFLLTPDQHYQFTEAVGTCPPGTATDNGNGTWTYETGGIKSDCTVVAVFAPTLYSLTMAVAPAGGGTTIPAGTTGVPASEPQAISATANTGYNFVNWTTSSMEAVVGDPAATSTTVTLTADATVTANFCSIETWYPDNDGDGYGDSAGAPIEQCEQPDGYVIDNTDCDDADPAVNPGAVEVCDGIDNNCDGNIDEGVLPTWYRDNDGDGYGDPGSSLEQCDQPAGYVIDNTDCNDADPAVNPGAVEVCDGIDNNCDGNIDEGVLPTWYRDSDGDGYGDPGSSLEQCDQPAGYVIDNTDCNDADALEYPGQVWYKDEDGDGFSDGTMTVSCERPETYYAAAELISNFRRPG
jgi:hypothetical protein